jgi:ethanolamine ammonia-lyase small subunit
LRRLTPARIALGRSGSSQPTRAVLEFELAHAQARDAVLAPLDTAALRQQLEADGWPTLEVCSRAADRTAYLARPDWGRRLSEASAASLCALDPPGADLALVVSDGLSSVAVARHAANLLRALRPLLSAATRIAPIVVATQARVALSDEIGACLKARVAVSIIGERPGLSSPDSLGLYLTYAPQPGRNDAERNCISNIRPPQGLAYTEAAQLLAALLHAALDQRCSGIALRPAPPQSLEIE